MKDVFSKLQIRGFVCHLQLNILWTKITKPFQIAIKCIKRYLAFRKINKESKDRWEKYVKISEYNNQDDLELRKNQFYLLKIQLIDSLFITSACAGNYVRLQEQPNEVDNYQKEFRKNKKDLINLLEKFCEYDEVAFDEHIKSEIIAWEFEKFKTQEERINWVKSISEYIRTIDII